MHVRADRGADALLVVDMFSRWDFPDARRLLRQAEAISLAVTRLAARSRRAGVPVIYCNDNHGDWRSDFHHIVQQAGAGAGARIVRLMAPGPRDYFVLKPRHSAFYATPLHLLLNHLRVRRLVVTGVTSDQCVLSTVLDAHIRGFDAVVPQDTSATLDAARHRRVLQHLRDVLSVATPASRGLRLAAPAPGTVASTLTGAR